MLHHMADNNTTPGQSIEDNLLHNLEVARTAAQNTFNITVRVSSE